MVAAWCRRLLVGHWCPTGRGSVGGVLARGLRLAAGSDTSSCPRSVSTRVWRCGRRGPPTLDVPGRRAVEAELRRCRTEADAARVDLQVLAAGVGGNGAAGMGDGGDWAACRATAVGSLSIWLVALSASWRSRRVVHRRSVAG